MSCDITQNQNQQERLIELAAMRQLYFDAKLYSAWQAALSVIPAIVWAVVLIFVPAVKVYTIESAVALVLLEGFFFEARQKRLLKTAARIQEHFDCATLCLDWNSIGGWVAT